MDLDTFSNQVYVVALNEAKLNAHEYVTPEHFLYAVLMFDIGKNIIEKSGGDIENIRDDLTKFFMDHVPKSIGVTPTESAQFIRIFDLAATQAYNSSRNIILLGDLIVSLFSLKDSYASYIMQMNGVSRLQMLKVISHDKDVKRTAANEDKKVNKTDKDFLSKFADNLTEKARNGLLDTLVGREEVLQRTIQVLCRRVKNNPIHIGEPGVGKTTIIEGLAQKIAQGDVPNILKGINVYTIDIAAILAGTKYRGDFEERFIKILDIVSKEGTAILYLDEIHTVVGAGVTSGSSLDAAGILKPYLTKGNIRFIGSTTFDEYKKYFEKDRAFSRRFQKIDILEPTVEETEKILNGIKSKYETYHNVTLTNDIISTICKMSAKYMHNKALPDKAIDVMDETAAYVRMISNEDTAINILEKDVERTIAFMAGIPQKTVSNDEANILKNLSKNLKNEIYGQENAVKAVVNAVKSSRAGLSDTERTVANLLFVGPTGVGKTEISKQLAKYLGMEFIRFDMSEYQEKHSIAKLIGTPPGYVGYEEGGLLTDVIRKTPHAVVLLDEIEKAHMDIFNILLQVMDYGQLTDNTGRKSDFRNIILIMTSNAGAKDVGKRIIGFDEKDINEDAITDEVKRVFSPEFRNRLDEIVVFNPINEDMAVKIVRKSIDALSKKLQEKNIKIKVTHKVIDWLAKQGISKIYGAREINRVVDKEIKSTLVDDILFGNLKKGGVVSVNIKENKINISTKS